MIGINLEQYQWLWAALTAGLLMIVVIVLTYAMLWRRRTPPVDESEPSRPPMWQWLMGYIPWVLLLTLLGVTVFTVIYTVRSIRHTPNW